MFLKVEPSGVQAEFEGAAQMTVHVSCGLLLPCHRHYDVESSERKRKHQDDAERTGIICIQTGEFLVSRGQKRRKFGKVFRRRQSLLHCIRIVTLDFR